MFITLLMLVGHVLVATYTYYATQSVISTLTMVAWTFTIYMTIKIIYVCTCVPRPRRYEPLRMSVPSTVDREHPPLLEEEVTTLEDRAVHDLVSAIIMKIGHAADEAAIHTFVNAKLGTLRRVTHERYASVISQINVIGFEGIIGTLIGLITFMAQAAILFTIPDITDTKSSDLVMTMIQNLNQIDLLTVSTAFLTSIIGWGAKAWIGQWIDERKGVENASITDVESWVQDELLARLSLPTQIQTLLQFVDLPELHRPLTEAVEQLKETSGRMRDVILRSGQTANQVDYLVRNFAQQLGPELARVVQSLSEIGNMEFDVRHVEGGIRLIPRDKRRVNHTTRRAEGNDATAR